MGDFNGRIKKVKVQEMNSGANNYKTIVVVVDDTYDNVSKVQVEFSKEMVPAPSTNPVYCDYVRENEEKSKRIFRNKDLSFKSSITGNTIKVVATMLGQKGEVLGVSAAFPVLVESANSPEDSDELL